MIKCKDNRNLTCISANGKPKSRWKTSDEAIENAKYINQKYLKDECFKLVAYKCTYCHHYHLTKSKKK